VIPLSVARIAAIVDGELAGRAGRRVLVDGSVEFDSRACGPGSLFVAFAGERVDGHDYLRAAADAGAVAALVTRGPQSILDDGGLALIVVPDAARALGALAAAVLGELPQVGVVGVTGSAGKTSTKDLIAGLLERLGPVVAPPGSFNNELGLPHTVLRCDAQTRFLVLEYSARGIGHIRYLTGIAAPRIAAVLNVGSAHLGEFGSRAAIAQAKGELVEALPDESGGGVAVLNLDDPAVAAMASRTAARIVTTGEAPAAQVRAADIELDDLGRPSFTLIAGGESARVGLGLAGRHQVANALSAAAVALECGASLGQVVDGLAAARPRSRWRMELRERPDGVVVINDAYNANPESMRAALDALARIGAAREAAGARSWAVLGPMAELGDDGPDEHASLGRSAARAGITAVLAVGDAAAPIAAGAAAAPDWAGSVLSASDVDGALLVLRDRLGAGDVVLVKASRSAGFERLAEALLADAPPQAPGDGARRNGSAA
jgi:UDP-N-acetylmuramoyl-tripeptide--D-alanyl-D-alanine ligase